MIPNKEYTVEVTPYFEFTSGGKVVEEFSKEQALAMLLAHDVVILNEYHWESTWPEKARQSTALAVICNDTFDWGCADAELITIHDIRDLFEHWIQDRRFGADVWCCKRREMMPQKPVADAIRKQGYWNIDHMNLQPNER